MAAPGTYRVSIAARVDGDLKPLGQPQSFVVEPIGNPALAVKDRAAELAFEEKVARLQRAVLGAVKVAEEAKGRLDLIDQAWMDTPGAEPKLARRAEELRNRLRDLYAKLAGDRVIASHSEPAPPAILQRLETSISWGVMTAPTRTQQDAYDIAAAEFAPVLAGLRQLIEVDLKALEDAFESAGAPWTPGRVPRWTPE